MEMLDAHIEFAEKTHKFHDVGNFEFIKKELEAKDKEIRHEHTLNKVCLLELAAKNKELAELKESVMMLARELRSQQCELNEDEYFAEATVLGVVFDKLKELLTNKSD